MRRQCSQHRVTDELSFLHREPSSEPCLELERQRRVTRFVPGDAFSSGAHFEIVGEAGLYQV